MGTEVSNLEFKKINNKWAINKINILSRKGLQKVSTTKKIKYKEIKGLWLIDLISVDTKHRLEKINRSRLNNLERKIATKVTFSNYDINGRRGLDYIRKMKQAE